MRILIQCANKHELAALKKHFDSDNRVLLKCSGMGFRKAYESLLSSLSSLNSRAKGLTDLLVVDFGSAGALHPGLKVGEVVVGTSAKTLTQKTIPIKTSPSHLRFEENLVNLSHLWGAMLTVEHPIETREDRKRLYTIENVVAATMETYAIADVCAAQKVSCISVRAITDIGSGQVMEEYLKNYRWVLANLAERLSEALKEYDYSSRTNVTGPSLQTSTFISA
ncbi:MAG: hypothetical protein AB7F43_01240 [Bacteriovoracia bacterium]